METTTGIKSKITLFDGADSQLQNAIFQHRHHLTVLTDTIYLHKYSVCVDECQWVRAHIQPASHRHPQVFFSRAALISSLSSLSLYW